MGNFGRITPLLDLAMMGALNSALAHPKPGKKRYAKPTVTKVEKESRQVRRARERRQAKGD